MTEDEQRIVVPGLRICAAEEDHISGKFDMFRGFVTTVVFGALEVRT